jgi:deoxyribonuclease V
MTLANPGSIAPGHPGDQALGASLEAAHLKDVSWPRERNALEIAQRSIAAMKPPRFAFDAAHELAIAGCFVCFPRGQYGAGDAGDPAWAAASLCREGRVIGISRIEGRAGAPYRPAQLALREGSLLEQALRGLPARPEMILANATGRDHPRGCGLALHLGFELQIASVGVTHRPLFAVGTPPRTAAGATAPLWLEDEEVARWVRVSARARPLVAHPGWRTDLDTAVAIVWALSAGDRARTPLPIRAARQAARDARAAGQGRSVGPSGPLVVSRGG